MIKSRGTCDWQYYIWWKQLICRIKAIANNLSKKKDEEQLLIQKLASAVFDEYKEMKTDNKKESLQNPLRMKTKREGNVRRKKKKEWIK